MNTEDVVVPGVVIKARRDGPYLVTGPITLTDADGAQYSLPEGQAVALCRCGGSANKPFCDSTHKEIGFQAPERASFDTAQDDTEDLQRRRI